MDLESAEGVDTVTVMAGSLGRFSQDPIILLDSSISLRSKVDRGGEGGADKNWLAKVTSSRCCVSVCACVWW